MKIIGTGSALPKKVVTNDMLSEILDTTDEWIRTRTGIEERRVLSDEQLEDIAYLASKRAIEDANLTAADIDYIICSTVISSFITPSLACMLQGMLGATCPAVDLNGACAGAVYALDMADAYLKSGKAKNILIICAENVTRFCDWEDRATAVLFGDGAGAMVVSAQGDALKAIQLHSDYIPGALESRAHPGNSPFITEAIQATYLTMNGQEVFKYAVRAAAAEVEGVLLDAGISKDEIKYFMLHQANLRILKSICTKMGQPMEKFPHNIERTGNTSSAGLVILLDEMARGGHLQKGDHLVLSAFGASFVTGACVIEWTK